MQPIPMPAKIKGLEINNIPQWVLNRRYKPINVPGF